MQAEDPIARVRYMDIAEGDLTWWETIGRRLEPVTPAVLLEVSDLHVDPCLHRIGRAAAAAKPSTRIIGTVLALRFATRYLMPPRTQRRASVKFRALILRTQPSV